MGASLLDKKIRRKCDFSPSPDSACKRRAQARITVVVLCVCLQGSRATKFYTYVLFTLDA